MITVIEALRALETQQCGLAPVASPAEAEGQALAGAASASLSAGELDSALGAPLPHGASCVHHVIGGSARASAVTGAFELSPASPQEALQVAIAARRLSQRLARPGLVRLDRRLADTAAVLTLPTPASVASVDPSGDLLGKVGAELLAAGVDSGKLVAFEGPRDAPDVLVVYGPHAGVAREAVARLQASGRSIALAVLRLILPFPAAALEAAIGSGARLHVLDVPGAPGRLVQDVRVATGRSADQCRMLPASAGQSTDSLVHTITGGAGDGFTEQPDYEGWPLLVVRPEGRWSRALVQATAEALHGAGLMAAGDEALVGEHRVRWAAAGPQPDLLLASHAGAVDVDDIAVLRPGCVVIFRAACASVEAAAQLLGPARAAALLAAEAKVWWLSAADDTAEAILGQFSTAALAALQGEPFAGLTELPPAELSPQRVQPEVDFRRKQVGLVLPASTANTEWAPRLRAFHMTGAGLPNGTPGAGVTSLAAQTQAAPDAWPLALDLSSQGVGWGRSVQALLTEAITSLEEGGRSGRMLRDVLPQLVAGVGVAALAGSPTIPLDEALDTSIEHLLDAMAMSDAARRELGRDLKALAGEVDGGLAVLPRADRSEQQLGLLALLRAAQPARARFLTDVKAVAEALRDLLLLDDLASAKGEQVAASFGAAARFFKPSGLTHSKAGSDGRSSSALSAERRAELERVLAILDRAAGDDAGTAVHALVAEPLFEGLHGVRAVVHPDPLGAASGLYDGLAAHAVGVVQALRIGRILAEGRDLTDAEQGAIERLDWQGLSAADLEAIPMVAVFSDGASLRSGGMGRLSALLLSSRPVRVFVRDQEAAEGEQVDFARYHAGLGWQGVAHREAFVLQSSLALPVVLTDGLDRLATAQRAALAVLRRAPAGLGEAQRRAQGALSGRAWPEFVYDPDAGDSWADRLDLRGNPQPGQAWPLATVPCAGEAGGVELEVAHTFADGVATTEPFDAHLQTIPEEAWNDAELLPLADWLEVFDAQSPPVQVPFIWTVQDGRVGRAAVTRALALACMDHQRAWRLLQELAGYGNVYAERAAAAARAEAEAEAQAERDVLAAAHAEELDQVRANTAQEAMESLASMLLDLDGEAMGSLGSAHPAAAPAPPAAPASDAAPEDTTAPPEPPPAPEDEDDFGSDPWIDTPLCASCNECVNLNKLMFQYNGDKQAELVDPSKGNFAQLVAAAKACPARCIHPGQPAAGDSSATPELVAAAAAFN